MKKTWISGTLVLMVALAVFMTGCSSDVTQPESETESMNDTSFEYEAPITTTLLQESGTGLWYIVSNGVAESLSASYPGSVVNITPGAAAPNILRLNDYQAEFAFTHSHLAYEAFIGQSSFEDTQDNIRVAATFYPSSAQFFLLQELGISSFDAFFEQQPKVRISIGSPGGSFHTTFQRIVESYGYTLEDLENWGCRIENKSQSDTSKMFSDGVLDGFFVIASTPSPTVVENAVNRDLMMVDISQDTISSLISEFGYAESTISAETYAFLDRDMPSFATYTVMLASDQTPEEKVFKMIKSIHENLPYMHNVHTALKNLSPELMAMEQRIPFHAGAEEYYRELGLMQ